MIQFLTDHTIGTMSERKIEIRDYRPEDNDFILDVNETNVEVLSPMDQERLDYFARISDMLRVVEVDGEPAAFLIALREGEPEYKSENYIWFSQKYDQFLYIDRIVIAEGYRGFGLGRKLYREVFTRAKEAGVDIVTCEVDIIPYNEPSLKFHEAMGFREVGQQVIRGGEIKVSLQVRDIEQ